MEGARQSLACAVFDARAASLDRLWGLKTCPLPGSGGSAPFAPSYCAAPSSQSPGVHPYIPRQHTHLVHGSAQALEPA